MEENLEIQERYLGNNKEIELKSVVSKEIDLDKSEGKIIRINGFKAEIPPLGARFVPKMAFVFKQMGKSANPTNLFESLDKEGLEILTELLIETVKKSSSFKHLSEEQIDEMISANYYLFANTYFELNNFGILSLLQKNQAVLKRIEQIKNKGAVDAQGEAKTV